ncbi:hypothetical protein [Phenylobacterium soli]|uniref:Uncharacterized protein n=1 Tax=Phenylobacterium soli TaxID=2170551 RepID=A0A328AEG0_9CAUL|nr:hypothetical protein [Phenylobacterium soli]RAK53182.1 hypothetical protein DJ017_00880 [Phenylobacterium soli]
MRSLALTLLLAAAAAPAAAWAGPVHPGEQRGLGLIAPDVPPLLKEARANPYALPADVSCPALLDQIAALDATLGPDLDAPQARKDNDLVMAGVRSVLPYGGVVRFVTGAGRKEKQMVDAALAGWERRGFLKGTARMMGCAVFGQPENPALAHAYPPAAKPAEQPAPR